MALKFRPGGVGYSRRRRVTAAMLAAGGGAVAAILLAQLEPFRTSATSFSGTLYGGATWVENSQTLAQWCDIDVPSGTAPGAGWPAVLWFHPNGSSKAIVDADLAAAKAACLAAGFAFFSFEFRHPVVNVALGAPHTDAGLAIQWARAVATALNLDTANFFGMTQSRGTLALWQALQADMANPTGPTWQSRQSSLLKGIWGYQGQTTYSTAEMSTTFIQSSDRAQFLADNPNDARWGSALASVATAPYVPHLVMQHREAYVSGFVPWNPGANTTATFDEHEPNFGAQMRTVYYANGYANRIATNDSISGANAWVGMTDWFKHLMAGATGLEAFALVKARKYNASLWYGGTSLAGFYTDTGRTTQAANGASIAAVNDRQYGLVDAAAGASSAGYPVSQATAAARPTLGTAANGRYMLTFDGGDRLSGATLGSVPAAETLICAGTWNAGANAIECSMAGRRAVAASTGLYIRRSSSNIVKAFAASGGTQSNVAATTVANDVPTVVSIVATNGGSADAWRDGSAAGQITTAYSAAAVTAAPTIGDEEPAGSARALRGSVFLALWAPAAMSQQDRQVIERFGCWLSGTTYTGP